MTPIRRYRLDTANGSWWEFSWQPGMGTYEAVHLTVDRHEVDQVLAWHGLDAGEITSIDRLRALVDEPIPEGVASALEADASESPSEASRVWVSAFDAWVAEEPSRGVPHVDFGTRWLDSDPTSPHHRVSWIPDSGELYATDAVGSHVRVFGVIAERNHLDRALDGWATVGAGGAPPLSWIEGRVSLWLEQQGPETNAHPEIAATDDGPLYVAARQDLAGTATARRLAAWQAELEAREASLGARERALGTAANDLRWSLPAAPVTEMLRGLLGEPGFSTSEVEEFARGINIDPTFTDRLLTGRIAELRVDQIGMVCEALHCSPYDLWGPDLARTILHAYGPERWPRHIEPLDADRTARTTDDAFLRRRLDARAAEMAGPIAAVVAGTSAVEETREQDEEHPAATYELTCYRRVAVLAVSPDGIAVVRDPMAAPDPGVEYHFSFRQVAEPQVATLPLGASAFATGPLPGFDTAPELATAAEDLRRQPWLAETELVRIADSSTGAEQWLGWDSDARSWQTWDDPRTYYPGDPTDVLDAGEFADLERNEPAVLEPLGVGFDV